MMRIALVGAVESSLVALKALVAAGHPPDLTVTLPMSAAGRHSDFVDLQEPARCVGSEIFTTTNINSDETIAALRASKPDVTMVIGWSRICREPFRSIATIGTLGFHPAPLPRMRGRAVIPWTILNGETTSGSTIFWLDEGVDSGPVVAQRHFPVDPGETARSLYGKHMRALAELIPEALGALSSGRAEGTPQDDSRATYCTKRTPEDGRIDWSLPSTTILRLIRAAGEPYPGAFTEIDGERIVIRAARVARAGLRGLPGQVLSHTDEGFAALCGDGVAIEVIDWEAQSDRRPPVNALFGESAQPATAG